jgi:AP-3 complex subunit beta
MYEVQAIRANLHKSLHSSACNIILLIAGVDPENNIAADVLRILVKNYADESDEVRAQTILLAAKVYLHYLNAKNEKQKAIDALNPEQKPVSTSTVLSPTKEQDDGFRENAFSTQDEALPEEQESKHPIEILYQYTMLLARYTPSYSLRDRARLFRSLLSVQSSTELASLLLLAPKPVPQAPSPSESRKTLLLGTTSLVIGSEAGTTGMRGYEPLPEWVESGREPDPKLRDDGDRATQKGAYVPERELTAAQRLDEGLEKDPGYKSSMIGGPKKEKTLDAWLDEESESEEETEEEEETESEEETDEEEDSEYETESEEDERAGLVKS